MLLSYTSHIPAKIGQNSSTTLLWSYYGSRQAHSGIKPLVLGVLLKVRHKKLDVKKAIQYSNEKMSHFSRQRFLTTELTTFYLDNKSCVNGLNLTSVAEVMTDGCISLLLVVFTASAAGGGIYTHR